MINLKLHQCYMPFIFIYPNSHTDKNNKDYYRAWFKTDKLEKKGFIVREDFYNKWNEKEIAEININLTEKGASIVSYYSFEDFEVKDSRKFVQTTGIYLDGTYIVNNPETGKKETTTFIPSFPNRFSFNSKGYRKFLSVNLKTYTRRQIMRHTGISNRDLTKEELKNVQDSVRYFYVISKYDYHYRYDGNEHGSWVIDTFSEWFSLVFYSKDALVESIESTNLATTDQIEEILKGLGDQEMILEKQVEYIKAIKKIAQTQFTDYLKVEVYSEE